MFDSALSILNQYIDTSNVSRFTFYSIEMERGENPEDIFYLCIIKDKYYVVFETDYVMNSLSDIAREATNIFEKYDLTPLHWIAKKESLSKTSPSTISINERETDELRSMLFSRRDASKFSYTVKHAVIEFKNTQAHKHHRFHPTAYSNIT